MPSPSSQGCVQLTPPSWTPLGLVAAWPQPAALQDSAFVFAEFHWVPVSPFLPPVQILLKTAALPLSIFSGSVPTAYSVSSTNSTTMSSMCFSGFLIKMLNRIHAMIGSVVPHLLPTFRYSTTSLTQLSDPNIQPVFTRLVDLLCRLLSSNFKRRML